MLWSWAVPKKPPLTEDDKDDKKIKRLAVEVEDHDSSYVSFEGVIPAGSYGAGTVSIWDHGFYELKEESAGKLVFVLHGAKMKGEYCLLKFKKQGKKRLWLIFKTKRKKG